MKTATSASKLRFLRGGHLASLMAVVLATLLGSAVASAQTASSAGHSTTAMQPASSANPQAATKPVHQTEEEKSEAKRDDASHQGIKVHGHWKIVVKNQDGSTASTHEFENSLYDGGQMFSYLLTGQVTVGEIAIQLNSYAILFKPCSPSFCFIISESATGYWANSTNCTGASQSYTCYPGLTVSVPVQTMSGTNFDAPVTAASPNLTTASLVLSGSFIVPADGGLGVVATQFVTCSAPKGQVTVSPAQCHANQLTAGTTIGAFPNGNPVSFLTATNINDITILAGQTVQVTVTLSFS